MPCERCKTCSHTTDYTHTYMYMYMCIYMYIYNYYTDVHVYVVHVHYAPADLSVHVHLQLDKVDENTAKVCHFLLVKSFQLFQRLGRK